jgi:hypothetical protein
MTVLTVIGLVGAGLYVAGLVGLVVAIAKTPPLYQAPEPTAADEDLIADLTASMRAYGETVADYYDTTPGD